MSQESQTATNSSKLAAALGVSRQTISYHRTHEGAPDTLCVRAWRTYLVSVGKSATVEKLEKPDRRSPAHDYMARCYALINALDSLFCGLSESLPAAVGKALAACGASLTQQQSDALIWSLWNEQAVVTQKFYDEWECPILGDPYGCGPFNVVEGKDDYELPYEIECIRKRLKAKKRPPILC